MLKKHYLVTKKIFQVILYLTEMIGISYLLTKITSIYLPTENFIDFFERMTIFFTFYQIIIFGIFQQLNDMKKDEYLAILTMYKYVELYNSDKREYIAKDIKNLIQNNLTVRCLTITILEMNIWKLRNYLIIIKNLMIH